MRRAGKKHEKSEGNAIIRGRGAADRRPAPLQCSALLEDIAEGHPEHTDGLLACDAIDRERRFPGKVTQPRIEVFAECQADVEAVAQGGAADGARVTRTAAAVRGEVRGVRKEQPDVAMTVDTDIVGKTGVKSHKSGKPENLPASRFQPDTRKLSLEV